MITRPRAVIPFSGDVAPDVKGGQLVQQIRSLVGVWASTSKRARERTKNIGCHMLCILGYIKLEVHISSIYSLRWFVG